MNKFTRDNTLFYHDVIVSVSYFLLINLVIDSLVGLTIIKAVNTKSLVSLYLHWWHSHVSGIDIGQDHVLYTLYKPIFWYDANSVYFFTRVSVEILKNNLLTHKPWVMVLINSCEQNFCEQPALELPEKMCLHPLHHSLHHLSPKAVWNLKNHG